LHLHCPWLRALQDAPIPTPPFLASGLRQHSRGRQQAVLLPLLQTLLIVASLVARWGCCSGQWRPRHLVDDGHRSGQTPEVGECPAAAVQQSLPMLHQSRVPTWDVAGFGGCSSRYTEARPDRLQRTVRWGGWCLLHRATWPLRLPHGKLRTRWGGSHLGAERVGCDVGLREKPLWPARCRRPCVQRVRQ
jgi:hypothetical protein